VILNKLGNADIQLSCIGLGTWAIGGAYQDGWGDQDDNDSIATIRRAIDLGINWLDTAPVYGLGHSEEVVGQALGGLRNKVYISSKCGMCWDANRNVLFRLKKESVRAEVEDSLRRLNTDIIDLYQIHKPNPEMDIEEAWDTLAELSKEGKIRYAGVSSFSLEQLKRVHAIHPVSFFQPEYSMLEPAIENNGILDFCCLNNIGVITFSSMGRGFLTGKFTREKFESLPADDFRRTTDIFFKEPNFSLNLKLVDSIRPFAERNNKTVAQLAIAWVNRRPEVTSAIVGARTPSQIEQTAPAGDWVLTNEEITALDSIVKGHQELLIKENAHTWT